MLESAYKDQFSILNNSYCILELFLYQYNTLKTFMVTPKKMISYINPSVCIQLPHQKHRFLLKKSVKLLIILLLFYHQQH